MTDPLSLAVDLVQALISRVKHVKVNHEQCQLLASLAEHTLSIMQKLEERVFDSSVTTSLELVVGALREADAIVDKCCKRNFLFAALYHEDHSLALKQASEKLAHAFSQIPLASLGMTADIQSDLVEIKAQIRNAKFEQRASVAHPIQGLKDALERAFNQTSQGIDEVKGLIQEMMQKHSSTKEELRNELVALKQFAFEANQNKERLQEFELNQIISVISESLGDVNKVSIITHDLEECYLCPISKDIMRDPVVLKESCMIYDRSSITEWLRRGHRSDPLTNIELVSRELVPNRALRKACQIILEQSGGQSSIIPSPQEEEEVVEQHIEPGLYEGQGKFLVGSSVIHTSQVLVLGPNGKVVGCTLYVGEILGVKDNGIDIGAGEWDCDTHEFSFGDCQFNYNGNIKLKTNVHQRGIEWSGRVTKGDALDEEYNFSLVYYPPFIGHEIPAYPTIMEMESKTMKLNGDISCHSKAVLSLERDSSVDGWISFESACLESKRIGRISRGSWNENGSLTFSIFFPSNETPLNSDLRPTNYEACFNVFGALMHGQTFPSPSFSGVFNKAQKQGRRQNVKAISSPLENLKMLEYPIIREASTPWHCFLQNPLKIFQLSRNFELERSQYAIREKFATHDGLVLHSQRAFGMSPLHTASANNSLDLVKVKPPSINRKITCFVKELIAQGVDINLTDNKGQSPLHHATFNNSIDVIKSLLSKGANANIQDKHGRSPLQIALNKNMTDVIELFDNKATIDLQDNIGWSKLHHAASHNDIDIVKKLTSKGARLDLQDKYGQTPLYITSRDGHIDIVKELIVNGANINLQRNNGASPLLIASLHGHIDVVKELIVNDARINLQRDDGASPLYVASLYGRIAVIKELIDKRANVNLQTNHGAFPLYVASRNSHTEVVKELIVNGADVNLQRKDGWTSLLIASQNGHIHVVKELIIKDANVNLQEDNGWSSLYAASAHGHIYVVKELIVNGAKVNLQNKNGAAPLYVASQEGHIDVVQELITNGANVNLQKNDGWTPLHIASSRGLVSIVKILLENRAFRELRNYYDETPYDVVCIDLGRGPFEDSTIRELHVLLKP